ncbi:unnamed protein product [Moneuplotes crassus]|uniref:Uncharacterized protein n=1 Tax=Euplotes crassus TaxID=5936 RepID=A0AAD1XSW1_EUPCR|nr:unnamed protein product [Moneuplotes crassus]
MVPVNMSIMTDPFMGKWRVMQTRDRHVINLRCARFSPGECFCNGKMLMMTSKQKNKVKKDVIQILCSEYEISFPINIANLNMEQKLAVQFCILGIDTLIDSLSHVVLVKGYHTRKECYCLYKCPKTMIKSSEEPKGETEDDVKVEFFLSQRTNVKEETKVKEKIEVSTEIGIKSECGEIKSKLMESDNVYDQASRDALSQISTIKDNESSTSEYFSFGSSALPSKGGSSKDSKRRAKNTE